MLFRHPSSLLVMLLLLFGLPTISLAENPAEMAPQMGAVPTSANEICPLLIGSKVPELTFKTVAGESFDLNAAIKAKPTVLIFYRGGW